MTIKGTLKKSLVDNGMSESEAKAVMEAVKNDPANKAMTRRWNDAAEDYPASLYRILRELVRYAALEYIDTNCPQAWFRPLFAGEEAQP